jgi:hypothetical protein
MLRGPVRVVALIGALGAASCSFLVPGTQRIAIQPMHPNAEVFVDGVPLGRGPTSVAMARRDVHSVIAKCGVSSGSAFVNPSISATGVLDLLGGLFFLVPYLGYFAPGFWKLEPRTVVVAIPDASACETPAPGAASAADPSPD